MEQRLERGVAMKVAVVRRIVQKPEGR